MKTAGPAGTTQGWLGFSFMIFSLQRVFLLIVTPRVAFDTSQCADSSFMFGVTIGDVKVLLCITSNAMKSFSSSTTLPFTAPLAASDLPAHHRAPHASTSDQP
jgi:hypothetical protein